MTMLETVHKAALAAGLVLLTASASAQERSPGLLDNLFNRGEQQREAAEQSAASELSVRIDRLEGRLREMTGAIEQLQFRNQQLEQEIARLGGAAPTAAAAPPRITTPPITAPALPAAQAMPAPAMPAPATSGRRSDAFDPSRNPNAPGVPRALGGSAAVIPAAPVQDEVAVGAPGGRAPGAPLDLSTLSSVPSTQTASADPNAPLPARPARNPNATGQQLATLPPSRNPKDEYDLAYGYVLHKDYALAEKAFADFLRKNPSDKLAPDAHYWLGESQFQRQRYQDAADSYLVVVRNYDSAEKAPDALLRLGQSLAALGQKEMACASLGEVNRKYPRASAKVKSGVAAEQKRTHC